jgi:hypothetical protein
LENNNVTGLLDARDALGAVAASPMAFPFAMQHFSALRRLVRNFLLSIPGFAVVRLAMLSMSTHLEFSVSRSWRKTKTTKR